MIRRWLVSILVRCRFRVPRNATVRRRTQLTFVRFSPQPMAPRCSNWASPTETATSDSMATETPTRRSTLTPTKQALKVHYNLLGRFNKGQRLWQTRTGPALRLPNPQGGAHRIVSHKTARLRSSSRRRLFGSRGFGAVWLDPLGPRLESIERSLHRPDCGAGLT